MTDRKRERERERERERGRDRDRDREGGGARVICTDSDTSQQRYAAVDDIVRERRLV